MAGRAERLKRAVASLKATRKLRARRPFKVVKKGYSALKIEPLSLKSNPVTLRLRLSDPTDADVARLIETATAKAKTPRYAQLVETRRDGIQKKLEELRRIRAEHAVNFEIKL